MSYDIVNNFTAPERIRALLAFLEEDEEEAEAAGWLEN